MPSFPDDNALPDFDPKRKLWPWGNTPDGSFQGMRISDALTGVVCFGGTGSGKTSGPAKNLARAYLEAGFSGLVLCAKPEERQQWERWAEDAGRWDREMQEGDLIIFDAKGDWRFNFLDWESKRPSQGGGLTINIVAMLDEIAGSIAGTAGKIEGSSGDSKFFEDALHNLNTNLVDLVQLSGFPLSLPFMRAVLNTAPQSLAEAKSDAWLDKPGECAELLKLADQRTAGGRKETRDDFEECKSYWTQEFPNLSEKTRSIITLSFSMLVRPFITRPLRKLFCSDSNIWPEKIFEREAPKILIVDLSVQEYRLAGRMAALVWKYCYQIAVIRRPPMPVGQYHLPTFLWWDEGQNFLSRFDVEWHAVARSAGGCSTLLVQTREALRSVLGNNDAVDALLANLQCKFFCQNSSIDSNDFASKLLGERYVPVETLSKQGGGDFSRAEGGTSASRGTSVTEQLRRYLEPNFFTTLKRGGEHNDYEVETVVYNGGAKYWSKKDKKGGQELLPYIHLALNQLE